MAFASPLIVFISSTCYDLVDLRAELTQFLTTNGCLVRLGKKPLAADTGLAEPRQQDSGSVFRFGRSLCTFEDHVHLNRIPRLAASCDVAHLVHSAVAPGAREMRPRRK